MKSTFLTIFLFFICCISISAQQLSSNQVIEDLNFLVNGIKQYNPALTVYNPNFDVKANQIIAAVATDSLTVIEYFKKVSQIVANSNEGHFGLGRWTDIAHKGFTENRYKYLPFSIKIINSKIYIWSDLSDENILPRGSEVLSINGISTSKILNELYSYIPSDGQIISNLEKRAEAGFPWMYYLFIEQPDKFVITLRSDNTDKEFIISALTVNQRNEHYKTRYADNAAPTVKSINDLYTFQVKKEYAVLTLKSFDYTLIDEYKAKADKIYSSIFEVLYSKKTLHLIVDLRNNTGGRNEFADEFVPFLNSKETGEVLKTTISWEGKERVYKFPKKHKYVFTGKIYVLINGNTYSAGATLARYIKEYSNAEIIGEETGTRYEGFVAGSSQAITLPHSQIIIGIPRYHILFPVSTVQKTNNRGLLPDHKVVESIEGAITNTDEPMEYVKALILQNLEKSN